MSPGRHELSPVVDGLEAATLLQNANRYCLLHAVAAHAAVRSSDLPRLRAGYSLAGVMMGLWDSSQARKRPGPKPVPWNGSGLGEANKSPQTVDQQRPLISRQTEAGGIDQSRQLLTAGPALPDLVSPHDNLRCCARAGGTLVNDPIGEFDDVVERAASGAIGMAGSGGGCHFGLMV